MEPQQVLHMLEQVASGSVSPVDAQRSLADQGYSDLDFAKVDTDRARRTGAGEVVYGAGKTADQIAGICLALRGAGQVCVLVTRLEAQKAEAVRAALLARDPQAAAAFEYRPVPQLGLLGAPAKPTHDSYIAVACAGTSDLYCAEEAAVTAEVLGSRVVRLYDVGVAGIHRLLAHRGDIAGASCVVAVAGMEGALASVVGGMVACPVIAVPTSVGYGASFGGVAALLAMLNSCASGVSVVNIDNGFGAGYQAHMIERAGSQHGEGEPDMKTLRWNLAENATRNQLLGDTLLQLPPDSRQRLEAAADAAGVPDRHHHDIGEVLATIDGLAVSPAVRDHMRAIYTILAEAEAAAHGCAVEQTHFHEVGDGSRIRNTLLVCLAVEATGAKRIVATVAQTGKGEVECAHGTLSIPAPATSAIIARGIPVSERTLPGERMTPTSAAMILHFVDEFE